MIKVGLLGYGRAGQAVANVLTQQPGIDLCWIARRSSADGQTHPGAPLVPVVGLDKVTIGDWLNQHPVDAIVDFTFPTLRHCRAMEKKLAKEG
jgi:4-hydroxy-tetrahydrodipicolinate reductase